MSAAHTPGPWAIEQVGSEDDCIVRTITGPNLGGGVAVAFVTTGDYSDAVEAANAHLMKASPDMLAALLYVREMVESGQELGMSRINAAIARAMGEQS